QPARRGVRNLTARVPAFDDLSIFDPEQVVEAITGAGAFPFGEDEDVVPVGDQVVNLLVGDAFEVREDGVGADGGAGAVVEVPGAEVVSRGIAVAADENGFNEAADDELALGG